MKESKNYAIPSLLKAFSILEYLADKDFVGFNQISRDLKLSKSTTYTLINTLLQEGYVQGDARSGYGLGIKLFALGNKSVAKLDIYDKSQRIMQRLSSILGYTSHLGVLDRNKALYIADVKSNNYEEAPSWVGSQCSLQTSAMGKAILAWRNSEQVEELLYENPPVYYTERAILNINGFMLHLDNVRKHGVSVNNRETDENFVCVAAPVFCANQTSIGAISVSVPSGEINKDLFKLLTKSVHDACGKLSKELGAQHYPTYRTVAFPAN